MLYKIQKERKVLQMKTVLKFDRVVLTNELNEKVKKVGDAFEIANILDDSFLLRDARTKTAIGIVNFEDFENHFVHEENFKGWTPWMPLTGFDGQTDAMYRTNRKKVQVKFLTDNVRAEACCNSKDDFNISFGIQVAYLRCLNKARLKKRAEYETEINTITANIIEDEHIIKKMINSMPI
jgi:hypothetical protein